MADSSSIDIPLLRVPFESLKRTSRDRKYIIDDLQALVTAIKDTAEKQCSEQDRAGAVSQLITQLVSIQDQLEGMGKQESQDVDRCTARLQHLKQVGTPSRDNVLEWSRKRLPRILADHLLRTGYLETAALLSESAHLQGLTDEHIFMEAQPIVSSLFMRDCGPALAWCQANKAKLKKGKSKLEFKLRTQEFIELVRSGEKLKAIHHSRQHLAGWADCHLEDFQQVMGALVFGEESPCYPYRELFNSSQWNALADAFYKELYRLNNMTQQSLLTLELQAGLSALKSPAASSKHESKEDPLHHQGFRSLAEGLPYAKHVHSRLICAITKEIMNENNPPMVLPTGTVYSQNAIQLNTSADSFVDPVTGDIYPLSELKRAYIS